jgi:hypothetical protein
MAPREIELPPLGEAYPRNVCWSASSSSLPFERPKVWDLLEARAWLEEIRVRRARALDWDFPVAPSWPS